MARTAERAELLSRCADITALALQLADDARSALGGALLQEALDVIAREARDAARSVDS